MKTGKQNKKSMHPLFVFIFWTVNEDEGVFLKLEAKIKDYYFG